MYTNVLPHKMPAKSFVECTEHEILSYIIYQAFTCKSGKPKIVYTINNIFICRPGPLACWPALHSIGVTFALFILYGAL